MRSKLISWLVQVNHQFEFDMETFLLSINFVDRFLATTPVDKNCLQLLGVAALLVAAKKVPPPLNYPTPKSSQIRQLLWILISFLVSLIHQYVIQNLSNYCLYVLTFAHQKSIESRTKIDWINSFIHQVITNIYRLLIHLKFIQNCSKLWFV